MYFLVILALIAGMIVSWRFKNKFEYYSTRSLSVSMTGKEVAEKMLKDNGIYDVQVVSIPDKLGDHYNPETKTVNLSPEVYSGKSIASAAVAAHECGHAVQHARAYAWLNLRSSLVPVVSVVSHWLQWVLMAGVMVLMFTHNPTILWLGIILFSGTTLFAFVTLPVEFDASHRALLWLNSANITNANEYKDAKDALWWAAMTYVSAALGSLLTLLYYISLARRND